MNPLKNARLSSGLSVNQVIERLGIKQPSYWQLENQNISVDKLAEICEKMNWKLTIEINFNKE